MLHFMTVWKLIHLSVALSTQQKSCLLAMLNSWISIAIDMPKAYASRFVMSLNCMFEGMETMIMKYSAFCERHLQMRTSTRCHMTPMLRRWRNETKKNPARQTSNATIYSIFDSSNFAALYRTKHPYKARSNETVEQKKRSFFRCPKLEMRH